VGRFAWVLVLLLAPTCGLSLPVATPTDVQRAQARYPGVTSAELERGRTLYGARCSVCHAPHSPTEFTADRWPTLVGEMRERAKLDDTEQALIERYLVTMAK
jgi:mono/diheme cytochrome c family protein